MDGGVGHGDVGRAGGGLAEGRAAGRAPLQRVNGIVLECGRGQVAAGEFSRKHQESIKSKLQICITVYQTLSRCILRYPYCIGMYHANTCRRISEISHFVSYTYHMRITHNTIPQ